MKLLLAVAGMILLSLVSVGCGSSHRVGYREVQKSYIVPTDSGSLNMGEPRHTYIRNYGL